MRDDRQDSARLIWVVAFLAAAGHETYKSAGDAIGLKGHTIKLQVESLERWLHRILVTGHNPDLTADGEKFIEIAVRIMKIVDREFTAADINKTRITADRGLITDGDLVQRPVMKEIANLLVGFRADLLAVRDVYPSVVRPQDIKI